MVGPLTSLAPVEPFSPLPSARTTVALARTEGTPAPGVLSPRGQLPPQRIKRG
jgi:hypothetical protein